MNIEWDGKTYSYEARNISVAVAIAIKDYTGLNLVAWERSVDELDPRSVAALFYAVKVQNGEKAPIGSVEFSLVAFYEAFVAGFTAEVADRVAAAKAAAAEEAAAVPPPVMDAAPIPV